MSEQNNLPMRDDLQVGSKFPDFELPDVDGKQRKLSEILGSYPGVLHFSRGSFCPKERRMHRNLVEQFQPELYVNYCSLITVMAQDRIEVRALKEASGAVWPFLVDADRKLLHDLQMVDTTDDRHGDIYIPYTFVLKSDRTIHKIYNGWWYLGRPTVENLRMDLREIMSQRDGWTYPGTGRKDWKQEKAQHEFNKTPGD